jgi:hypothetical protein
MVVLLCGSHNFHYYVSFSWPCFLWLRLLVATILLWRSVFDTRSVHVGFVVKKMTLGQVSFLSTSAPDSFIHLSPMLHNLSNGWHHLIIHLENKGFIFIFPHLFNFSLSYNGDRSKWIPGVLELCSVD